MRFPKLLRFLYLAPMLLMMGACKPEFTVDFELSKDVDTHCRLVYYASSKKQGVIMEPVVDISAGKGKLIAPTKYPSIVYVFSTSASTPSAIFYVRRGDHIKISGDGTNPMDWEIKGNSLSEKWSEWRLANKPALISGGKELNRSISDYVTKNPDSQLSTALLILQYSRRDDEEGFLKLFKSLKPGATSDRELMAALAVADMPGGEFDSGGNLSKMVLSAPSGDADTLFFNKGKASLLIFRDNKNREYLSEEKDSLKTLLKEFPDSSSRMIARIYLDPDSMTWIKSVKSDSLRNIAVGWMPHGVADSTAMAVGVKRTPYYIVADGKGKQVYRGSDLKKSIEIFRKTARKK